MKTNKQMRRLCVNHWKRMLKLSVEDIKNNREAPEGYNCAFCIIYARNDCADCPIYLKTGETSCQDTPFRGAYDYYENIRCNNAKNTRYFRERVQEEIDFLEELEL